MRIVGKEFKLKQNAKDKTLPALIKICRTARLMKYKCYDYVNLLTKVESMITYHCIRHYYEEV